MNDFQKTVLESFRQFVRVCNELNLKYYLVNGSALGALKYEGFIPWDDDLDVAMPREDYMIFLQKAQQLLPENLFVQNYITDRQFPFIYSKIRNSDTTFIENSVSHLEINHGIYMDIFPLDSYHEPTKTAKIKTKLLFWWAFSSLNDQSKTKIRIRNRIMRFFGFDKTTYKAIAKIEKIISDTDKESYYLCNYGDRQGKGKILREWYGNGYKARFENMEVVVPKSYDEYLTCKYGNWRDDLPANEQKSHHKANICDVHMPYKEYIKKQTKGDGYD